MRLLWIATKAPAPPTDGGRLVALLTVQALVETGLDVTLVAPVDTGVPTRKIEDALAPLCRLRLVPVTRRHPVSAALRSLRGRRPYTIASHLFPAVRTEVARLIASEHFDAVHVEQVQAFEHAEPAVQAAIPLVLRAQNVESDLWRATAPLHPWAGPWLAREARRLARYEGEAVRRAGTAVALTKRDADRLRELAGPEANVVAIPPPFPSELPPSDRELPGRPPLVLLGSGGWLPNRDATRWFLGEVWPEVRARVSGAVLHLFGAAGERPGDLPLGIVPHPSPQDSREAFARNAILIVPLRIASGIRMKILEAWARGVPVIATPEAAAGLEAEDGRELILARSGAEVGAAAAQLAADPSRRARLVAHGRQALETRHGAETIASLLRSTARQISGGSA